MSAPFTLAGREPGQFGSEADYFQAREALVNAEREQSFRGGLDVHELEVNASKIVDRIKSEEERELHRIHADGTGFEAGHKYLHGVDSHVGNSKLLMMAQQAPKGCLLHCHFDAMLPPDDMLRDAREFENLHISSDVPLTSKGFFDHALPLLRTVADNKTELSETADLFSKSYIPGSFMKYSQFLSAFPGGAERAEQWIKKRIVLTSDNAYHPEQTVNG
jgi:adenosine deaminase CECR1